MNGLEATRRIMAERPTPIVVIAASVDSDDFSITMNALRYGALAVIEKPCGVETDGFSVVAENIRTQLFIMSQVKVVRQRGAIGGSVPGSRTLAPRMPRPPEGPKIRALGIACSTGGPSALSVVLRELPAEISCPILLVQHIPPTFVAGFAAWIASLCRFEVRAVSHTEFLRSGCIYLAAPDRHLSVTAHAVTATDELPVSGQRPAATILFRSMALAFGSSGAGVLMTGMGDDGALGLLEMRCAGALTIAEDESTAVVYGMPAAAVACGAVCELLALPLIATRISELLGCSGARAAGTGGKADLT
jgi:two-component system chemotaxis response regulator CheB